MDAEVFRDLHERHPWTALEGDADDIITELFRETRGHNDHPSGPAETGHVKCHLNMQQTPFIRIGGVTRYRIEQVEQWLTSLDTDEHA